MLNKILLHIRKILDTLYIPNKYIPADKQRHFISGAVGGILLYLFLGIYSILFISIIAAGKEANDYLHKDIHTPDIFDWIATTVGSIVSVAILFYIL